MLNCLQGDPLSYNPYQPFSYFPAYITLIFSRPYNFIFVVVKCNNAHIFFLIILYNPLPPTLLHVFLTLLALLVLYISVTFYSRVLAVINVEILATAVAATHAKNSDYL